MDPRKLPDVPLVCCVVVNWNGREDTLRCLAALERQSLPVKVVVVDNGSSDGSAAAIREHYPAVHTLETGANLGFAGGTNAGVRWAAERGADFIWLLNNDTDPAADTLERLLRKIESEPGLGAVGSVLYRMDRPEVIQAWGGGEIKVNLAYSRHFTEPEPMGPRSYLTFASVLFPMRVLREVGLLYEGFFMYFDDSDLAIRLRKRGYGLAVAERTNVLHKEGGSSIGLSPLMDRYATTSALRFLRRHARWPSGSMFAYLALRLANRLVRRRWKNVSGVLAGFRVYWQERGRVFRETL